MFDFFKNNSPYKVKPDKIWLKTENKLNGLLTDIENESGNRFIITFFNKTFEEIREYLGQKGCGFKIVENFSEIDNRHGNIYLLTTHWQKRKILLEKLTALQAPACFLFLGHYPLFSLEDEVLQLIGKANKKNSIQFYNSLDTPFFDYFGGENLRHMMEKMSAGKEECFSGELITKSIVRAQKKLDTEIGIDRKTDSMEDWFKVNKKQF